MDIYFKSRTIAVFGHGSEPNGYSNGGYLKLSGGESINMDVFNKQTINLTKQT